MASFSETDAGSGGKDAALTDKNVKDEAHQEPAIVSETSQHTEQSLQFQGDQSTNKFVAALQTPQPSSSKAPEASVPAGSGTSSVKSCEVKPITSLLGTGLGNIVDYPITPESSEEEEEMEAEAADAGVEEHQPESQICQQESASHSADQSGSKEEATHSQVETKSHDEESSIRDSSLAESKNMDIPAQLEEYKYDSYENLSDSSDDESVVTVPEVHVKPKQDLISQKDMAEPNIIIEKEEEPKLCMPPKEDLNPQKDMTEQTINIEKKEVPELRMQPKGDLNPQKSMAEQNINVEKKDEPELCMPPKEDLNPQKGMAEQNINIEKEEPELHVQPKEDLNPQRGMAERNIKIEEKEKELQHKPSAEGDFNNSAKVPAGDKTEAEAVAAEIDDTETASQGSAEFQPQLDDLCEKDSQEGSAESFSVQPVSMVSDTKVADVDKSASPETKAEVLESMDVDGEESIQDVDEVAGTPAAALDVDEAVGTPPALDADEAVGTPTAALDVEDGDSLLPDTELQETKTAVSKTGGFPITEAFMDENSLSLDCVLGISSTVPEGDVSMDISICSKECPTPAKRSRPGSVMSGVEPDADDDGTFQAENLFEYQWPLDGGEWYMLQEQLSEYLQIKSFKRKYPDLYRRTCDKNEKDFLRERLVVSETQCDLGLTALRSEEVYDLMHKDYQEKYREYAHVLHEKERQTINNKHKEYEVPKLDKGKMGAYIKKAVKAAADFNAQFQRERREERRAYFDLQTFMIQYPAGRYKKLPPERTKPGAHPVGLIPGQFQNYYCKYTSDELKYLPLNTAVFDPPKRMSNTLVKPTSDQESSEVEDSTEDKAGSASEGESDGDGSSDSEESDSDAEEETKSKEEVLAVPLVEEKCRICNSADPPPPEKKLSRSKKGKQEKPIATDDQEMIKCSECGTVGHPSCLDLTNAMVSVIRTYPWQCMECKTCVECMDPYDEDKMMFCDRCDRGYHTFCVGLRSIPTGKWECRSCKGTDTPRARKRTSLAK